MWNTTWLAWVSGGFHFYRDRAVVAVVALTPVYRLKPTIAQMMQRAHWSERGRQGLGGARHNEEAVLTDFAGAGIAAMWITASIPL